MSSSSLEVPRRPRPEKRSRAWRILTIVAALLLVALWVVWYLRSPDDLPTSARTAEGKAVVGQEVYVGMLAVGDGFERTLHISDVTVEVETNGEVEVSPKLCPGGSLSVTTDASGWCPELEDVEGADLTAGDSIVLVVSAAEPAEVEIGRIEVSFREGIRSGTKAAGLEGASLTFAEHDPATVEETPDSEGELGERPGGDDEEPNDDRRDKDDKQREREGRNA